MTFHLWPLTLLTYDLFHLLEKKKRKESVSREPEKNRLITMKRKLDQRREVCSKSSWWVTPDTDWFMGDSWEMRLNSEWQIADTVTIYYWDLWLGYQLVWPCCRCCHASLITAGWQVALIILTSVIITATHTLIEKSLVLNSMSFLISVFLSLFFRDRDFNYRLGTYVGYQRVTLNNQMIMNRCMSLEWLVDKSWYLSYNSKDTV